MVVLPHESVDSCSDFSELTSGATEGHANKAHEGGAIQKLKRDFQNRFFQEFFVVGIQPESLAKMPENAVEYFRAAPQDLMLFPGHKNLMVTCPRRKVVPMFVFPD